MICFKLCFISDEEAISKMTAPIITKLCYYEHGVCFCMCDLI